MDHIRLATETLHDARRYIPPRSLLVDDGDYPRRPFLAQHVPPTRDNSRLERRLEDFQRRVTSELEALRKASGPFSSFIHFGKLPPELRLHIWELAIPRRLICNTTFGYTLNYRLRPPTVAHVCRESRAVALRRGGLVPHRLFAPPDDSKQTGLTWFNPGMDIAVVGKASRAMCEPTTTQVFTDLRGISSTIDAYLGKLRHLPNIRTIWVGDKIRVDRTWHPTIITALFGGDSVVILDLRDSSRVRRVMDILSKPVSYGAKSPREARRLLRTQFKQMFRNGPKDFWPTTQRNLQVAWLKARFQEAPLTFHSRRLTDRRRFANTRIPWVAETIKAVEFRPAFLFYLADQSNPCGRQDLQRELHKVLYGTGDSDEEDERVIDTDEEDIASIDSDQTLA